MTDYLKLCGEHDSTYTETLHKQCMNWSVLMGLIIDQRTDLIDGYFQHIVDTQHKLNSYDERLSPHSSLDDLHERLEGLKLRMNFKR
jgi:hypothetical protein